MGSLKPDATYIYERADGIVYAREFGADPSTRQVVGYESGKEYDPVTGHRTVREIVLEDELWADIRRAAKTNPTLQDALNHAIIIYKLTKTNE
jgi:hypothetical protein